MLTFLLKEGITGLIMNLSGKLRKFRLKGKLSMSQVARLSGTASDPRGRITQGYISRLESGKETNPSLLKLMTLCRIYKIRPRDLFPENTPRRSKSSP
jgi:transcriptional regulator with XRE-family HTH domain